MKNILLRTVVVNVLIAVVLLTIFYFSVFLSGYGSNASYLPQEKNLFAGFVIFHFAVASFFLYRFKQFNLKVISATLLVVVTTYLIAAWYFEYFG